MLSRKYRIWDQRRADLLAVKRGRLKELLALSRWVDEQKKIKEGESDPENGLSTEELEKLVLKI